MLLLSQTAWAGVDFEAEQDMINWGDVATFDGATSYSISFWIYEQTQSNNRIITKWNNIQLDESLIVQGADTDEILFGIGNAVDKRCAKKTSGADIAANTWTHVVGTWSATCTMVIYVNGVSQSLTSVIAEAPATFGNSANSLQYGFETDESISPIDMILDEVAMWKDVILSQAQVDRLKNSRGKRFPLQLSASWFTPLDEVSDGGAANNITFTDIVTMQTGTGDDGANNTGLTGSAEAVLTYP